MEIKKLTIQNLGRFDNLEVNFAPTEQSHSNVTVFIGNNGAGKTSILDALATSLSWFIARVRNEKGNGNVIAELAIINDASYASIDLQLCDDIVKTNSDSQPSSYQWSLVKTRKGRKSDKSSNLGQLNKLVDKYRQHLTDNTKASLPLIAYYPVERSVLDIPLKIRGKHNFNQIDGYDGSLNRGVDFRRFFEWFREREDIENEEERRKVDVFLDDNTSNIEKIRTLLDIYTNDSNKRKKDGIELIQESGIEAITINIKHVLEEVERIKQSKSKYQDRQLNAVRTAISDFMPDLTNIRVQRKPRLHMAVDKNGKSLNVMQLSQGEKSLMALVGDIARRLAMMNPNLENPLHGDGIILIDEVDMHLHPSWQRNLIQRFTHTFPNCQIILSTHSPLIISDHKDILVYLLQDGKIGILPPLFGEDVNTVLLEAMDTYIRDPEIDEKLKDLLDAIHNADINKAKEFLEQLEKLLPMSNMELAKARLLLRKKELQLAKNN